MRAALLCLLTASALFGGELPQKINERQAMAIAERYVKEQRLLEPSPNPPPGPAFKGHLEARAWGYNHAQPDVWWVIFRATYQPAPQITGRETAWAAIVQVDGSGQNVFLAHGAAVAYDGGPFKGYTRRADR